METVIIKMEVDLESLCKYLMNCGVVKESLNDDMAVECDTVNFRTDSIDCKSFPLETRGYIKFTQASSSDLYSLKSSPNDFKLLRFPMNKTKTFAGWLKNMHTNIEYSKAIFTITSIPADESGVYDAQFVTISVGNDKMNIPAIDRTHVKFFSDSAWSNIENKDDMASFILEPQMITRIKKYITADKHVPKFTMKFGDNKLVLFSKDIWQITHSNGVKSIIDNRVEINKHAFNQLDSNHYYDVSAKSFDDENIILFCKLRIPDKYYCETESFVIATGKEV